MIAPTWGLPLTCIVHLQVHNRVPAQRLLISCLFVKKYMIELEHRDFILLPLLNSSAPCGYFLLLELYIDRYSKELQYWDVFFYLYCTLIVIHLNSMEPSGTRWSSSVGTSYYFHYTFTGT
jgi:hypothetical protein